MYTTSRCSGDRSERPPPPPTAAERLRPAPTTDRLPYRVELWSLDRTQIETVLALTSNGTIGYAAFYAALKEHPDRHVTLSLDGRLLSQASGPMS